MGNEFSILEQRINFQITVIHRLYFLRIGGEGKEALGSSAVASLYMNLVSKLLVSVFSSLLVKIGAICATCTIDCLVNLHPIS